MWIDFNSLIVSKSIKAKMSSCEKTLIASELITSSIIIGIGMKEAKSLIKTYCYDYSMFQLNYAVLTTIYLDLFKKLIKS